MSMVFGTQDTVTAGGGTSAVTDTSFSVAADAAAWTNDDDYSLADVVLKFQYPSGTLASPPIVNLRLRKMNVDSTNDEPVPDGLSSAYPGHLVGTFVGDQNLGSTTDTYLTIEIHLPNAYTSQVYEFYIENQTDVTMTAGWTLKVTPKDYA